MNASLVQSELTDDAEAHRLLLQINRQMIAREKIYERIEQLQRKIVYRTKRIRQLSLQRGEVLNLKLPL